MEQTPATIALLTDFGTSDIYVGVMKGVIAGIAPQARIIDLTHDIAPQRISEAAWQLSAAYSYFPPSTVFCCVVDPGVGTERRAVAVRTERSFFIAPDNGLLSIVLRREKVSACVLLDNEELHLPDPSATFHGRDVFAPVAAHLAAGTAFGTLGSAVPVDDLTVLGELDPVRVPGGWKGKVVVVDRFGNLITNLLPEHLGEGKLRIDIAGARISRLLRTYADAPPRSAVAYIGSAGLLELAVSGSNAAREWYVEEGADVFVYTDL